MRNPVRLDVAESFEVRHYRRRTEGLAVEGLPWLPLVGRNSYLRTINPTPWHTHNGCIEVIYCQHGMCEYESCGTTFQLKPGRLFISRPSEVHRMLSNPKGLATYYLLFRVQDARRAGEFGRELRFIERKLRQMPRLFDCEPRTGSHFVKLFHLIDRPFGDKTERRLRILNTCLTLLLSIIDASDAPLADGGSSRIRALAEDMRAHPDQDYPIESLATRIGFSPSSLIGGFKATMGYSPHAYLIKCRIDRAKELLGGGRKIAAVAATLGFPSPQHFSTQFRNSTGLSPREWIARMGS